MVERLHRRLLDVIKDEFDRRGRSDVNAVQALLLYNIGDKELTAGELRTKRLLSRLERFLQRQEAGRDGLPPPLPFAHRPSLGSDQPDRERQGGARIVAGVYEKHARTIEQIGGIPGGRLCPHERLPAAPRAILDRPDQISALITASVNRKMCSAGRLLAEGAALRSSAAIGHKNALVRPMFRAESVEPRGGRRRGCPRSSASTAGSGVVLWGDCI